MRRAAKRDRGEDLVVAALRAAGAFVYRDLKVDLLVSYRGEWKLLELKAEDAKPRKDQRAQREFCELHDVPIVKTPTEALAAIGAVRLPGERNKQNYAIRLGPELPNASK